MVDIAFTLHDLFIILTIVELVMLAALHSMFPPNRRGGSNLLVCYLLCASGACVSNLLVWSPSLSFISQNIPSITGLLMACASLFKGPLLYLYLSSLLRPSSKIGHSALKHLVVPGIIILTFLVIDMDSIRMTKNTDHPEPDWGVLFAWTSMRGVPMAYGIFCLFFLFRLKNVAENYYDSADKQEVFWIKILIVGYALHWSWGMIYHILGQFIPPNVAHLMGVTDDYVAFVLVNLLIIYSFKFASKMLSASENVPLTRNSYDSNSTTFPENQNILLTESKYLLREEEIFLRIQSAIEQDKFYLRKNLNIQRFAEALKFPTRDVSQVINARFAKNFSEFINYYRVEEAKMLLRDKHNENLAIGEIISRSGFNSTSAFHRFFKRYTGVTPTVYKVDCQNQSAIDTSVPASSI